MSLSVDALVYDKDIPDDSVVIRRDSGEIIVKKRTKEKCMAQNYFRDTIL